MTERAAVIFIFIIIFCALTQTHTTHRYTRTVGPSFFLGFHHHHHHHHHHLLGSHSSHSLDLLRSINITTTLHYTLLLLLLLYYTTSTTTTTTNKVHLMIVHRGGRTFLGVVWPLNFVVWVAVAAAVTMAIATCAGLICLRHLFSFCALCVSALVFVFELIIIIFIIFQTAKRTSTSLNRTTEMAEKTEKKKKQKQKIKEEEDEWTATDSDQIFGKLTFSFYFC